MILETTGIDAIEEALLALLKFMADGEPVLNERAPGPRPQNVPFTTFMVYWEEGHAFVFRKFEDTQDGGFREKIGDDSYFTARLVCYGKDSMKRCGALRMMLNSDISQVQQFRRKIGVCDVDDIQAIPESDVDGTVRERAYFNFKFYARVVFSFDVDWFNSFSLVVSVPELNKTITDAVTGA